MLRGYRRLLFVYLRNDPTNLIAGFHPTIEAASDP